MGHPCKACKADGFVSSKIRGFECECGVYSNVDLSLDEKHIQSFTHQKHLRNRSRGASREADLGVDNACSKEGVSHDRPPIGCREWDPIVDAPLILDASADSHIPTIEYVDNGTTAYYREKLTTGADGSGEKDAARLTAILLDQYDAA
jgi:hypothetical protein